MLINLGTRNSIYLSHGFYVPGVQTWLNRMLLAGCNQGGIKSRVHPNLGLQMEMDPLTGLGAFLLAIELWLVSLLANSGS